MLNPSTSLPLKWTVIFEYSLPLTTTLTQGAWAAKWHDLSSVPFSTSGDDRYNAKLQAITDIFTATSFPDMGFVRDIALNQLRTNELALGSPWELREFRMRSNGSLEQVTVKNNPDISFNTNLVRMRELQNFILDGGGSSSLPNSLPSGLPLLGGTAPVVNHSFKWFSSSNDPKLRAFSTNTCNGCHAGDTGTSFVHLSLRSSASVSNPSGFLINDTINRKSILRSDLIQNFCQ